MRISILFVLLLAFAWPHLFGADAPEADPLGILLQPIPDKLVVLTFDDAPASHATIVAPILKERGFGGSFYVCDFDSFRTRKDWYLTYRQMKTLTEDGFEVGNHTKGHAGGAGIEPFLNLEDDLVANNVPKPTTVCWPVYLANPRTYPELAAHGYRFGRGGHFRAYRPTIDNPFDVPSFSVSDSDSVETFINYVQQARQGRIVVLTFHGVPDREHPTVGLEPETFKVMMNYLKDNGYQCVALRDLAKYIDPVKAAKLPPTSNKSTELDANALRAKSDKAKKTRPDAITPSLSSGKEILSLELPGSAAGIIAGTNIELAVLPSTELQALAPVFTLSPLATAVPASGSVRDFTKPQPYTITAQDGTTKVYTVRILNGDQPRVFTWQDTEGGNWSEATKWKNNLGTVAAPQAAGQPNYVLSFGNVGKATVTNDLAPKYQLNQLLLRGPLAKLAGNTLALATNEETGTKPRLQQQTAGSTVIVAPLELNAATAFDTAARAEVTLSGLVSGPGSLLKNGPGRVRITNPQNTFRGGTVINEGSLFLLLAKEGLGTGTIILHDAGSLDLEHVDGTNPLVLYGGTIEGGNGFGNSWNSDIEFHGNTKISSYADFKFNNQSGSMRGPGGFTIIGTMGGFNRRGGMVTLCGSNSYQGPTIVTQQAVLRLLKAKALYQGESTKWTADNIRITPTSTLRLSAGGPEEFTGAELGTLLKNLTASINNTGLMARAVFSVDTANARETISVTETIIDSQGPGGGAFVLKKQGAGTLRLAGNNTYTGQTIFDEGTLLVAAFNSYAADKRLSASSLGAPQDIDAGEIVIGEQGKDSTCALVYTGAGETTDRVLNLAGKKMAITLEQAGTGLLKFTSSLLLAGHGANKTIILQGDTAGVGELAGDINNPHDRSGKATTSVTKLGSGTWTLAGTNRYTGPTNIQQGTLALAAAQSLGPETEVQLATGAALHLKFTGTMNIRHLKLAGKPQPPGEYSAVNCPEFLRGTGKVKVTATSNTPN